MILDMLFNSYKIKYVTLSEHLNRAKVNIKRGTTTNVYINLDSVLRDISKPNIEKELRVYTEKEELLFIMMSNILNLAAHYRDYFTKSGVYSRIILYGSFPFRKLELKSFYIETYKQDFFNRINADDNFMIRQVYEEALKTCKAISTYIEDVHIVTTDKIEPSLIPYIFETNITKSDELSFIVTKDKYDYQYCNKDFVIFRPKRNDHHILTKENMLDRLKIDNNISNNKNVDMSFYPFIYSLLGDTSRGIPKIKRVGLSSILDYIVEGQKNNIIGETNMSIYILAKLLNDDVKKQVMRSYDSIDISTQYSYLNNADKYNIIQQCVNRFDNDSLKTINDEYFIDHPIMLLELINAKNDYINGGAVSRIENIFKMV